MDLTARAKGIRTFIYSFQVSRTRISLNQRSVRMKLVGHKVTLQMTCDW